MPEFGFSYPMALRPTFLQITLACLLSGGVLLRAEEKPAPVPRVTSMVPLAVPQGFTGSIRLRGFLLKDATGVRVDAASVPVKAELKDKKDAGIPNGMEKDLTGDTEVTVDLALPAEIPAGPLSLTVTAGETSAAPVVLQIQPKDGITEEKEPNNGFRQATKGEVGHTITGTIREPRDVDVFALSGKAGQRLRVTALTTGAASLLDPLLTAHDAAGNALTPQGAAGGGTRGAVLEITPATDGPVFIVLQDALDFGGEWHSYQLAFTQPVEGETASPAEKDSPGVSFSRDVWPVLRANCTACHRPGKLKGGLDLTSMAALSKGGKHGLIVKNGDPAQSEIVEAVSGEEPDMPPEGDPLTGEEIAIISRWIAQGAADDTPPTGLGTRRPAELPVYTSLPSIPALTFSPDGSRLAVAAHHEIILHQGDGSAIMGRWPGDSPRLESLAFSPDGRFLAASGGSASEFGEIQIWDVATGTEVRSIRASTDSLYGISWSDDGSRLAAGGADKLVRAFDVRSGDVVMQCDNHLDWVFGTAFVHDGTRLISVSRDKGVKLIDVASGHLIDDAARPRDPVLALARHPAQDLIAFTGNEGKVRLHRMAPRGGRLKEGDDREESAVREFEHMSTTLHAVAFSADGSRLACGGQSGEIRIFATENGKREATIPAGNGPVFTLAFHPVEKQLAAAGSDGQIRFYSTTDGKLIKAVPSVPVSSP